MSIFCSTRIKVFLVLLVSLRFQRFSLVLACINLSGRFQIKKTRISPYPKILWILLFNFYYLLLEKNKQTTKPKERRKTLEHLEGGAFPGSLPFLL